MPRSKKTTKKQHVAFWKIYLVIALLLIGGGLLIQLVFVAQPSFTQAPPRTTHYAKNVPLTKIIIPSISVSLHLESALVTDGRWYVSPDQGTFLGNGSYPTEKGSIIVYGHNKEKIFGPLRNIKKDATITLINADKKVYSYKLYSIQVVSPYQIDVLEEEKETLIIFTCTGFADSKRLVIKASPIK